MNDETREQPAVPEIKNDLGIEANPPRNWAEYLGKIGEAMETRQSMEQRLVGEGVLRNWVNERTLLPEGASLPQRVKEEYTTPIGKERHARKVIADAIKDDLYEDYRLTALGSLNTLIPGFPGFMDTEAYKKAGNVLSELARRAIGEKLTVTRPDAITGESITAEVFFQKGDPSKYELPGWVWTAREIDSDGRVIAEAKISEGTNVFNTELTLNFTGDRFDGEARNANPKIIKNRILERGASTTFSLLANHVLNGVAEDRAKASVVGQKAEGGIK